MEEIAATSFTDQSLLKKLLSDNLDEGFKTTHDCYGDPVAETDSVYSDSNQLLIFQLETSISVVLGVVKQVPRILKSPVGSLLLIK